MWVWKEKKNCVQLFIVSGASRLLWKLHNFGLHRNWRKSDTLDRSEENSTLWHEQWNKKLSSMSWRVVMRRTKWSWLLFVLIQCSHHRHQWPPLPSFGMDNNWINFPQASTIPTMNMSTKFNSVAFAFAPSASHLHVSSARLLTRFFLFHILCLLLVTRIVFSFACSPMYPQSLFPVV